MGGELPAHPRAEGARPPAHAGGDRRVQVGHRRMIVARLRHRDAARPPWRCSSTTAQAPRERRDDPAPGERPRHATQLLRARGAALADGRLGFARRRAARRRRRARGRSPGCASASPPPARSRRRAARPSPACPRSRRSPRGVDGGATCSRSSTPAAARRSPRLRATASRSLAPAALAPEALERLALPAGGADLAGRGDGAVRFRDALERAGATVLPDIDPAHRISARGDLPPGPGGGASPREARAGLRPRPGRGDRPRAAAVSRRASTPPPHLRRPPAGHRHRAPHVRHAVVARDVRPRAVQAERHLPRRAAREEPLAGT